MTVGGSCSRGAVSPGGVAMRHHILSLFLLLLLMSCSVFAETGQNATGDADMYEEAEYSACSKQSFMMMEKKLLNLTLVALTHDPDSRNETCSLLWDKTYVMEDMLETCWEEEAEAALNDTMSVEDYSKFVRHQNLENFKDMLYELCDSNQVPAETSEDCDLGEMEMAMHKFYWAATNHKDQERCSVMWMGRKHVMPLLEKCSEGSYPVLEFYKDKVNMLVNMACSPATCNVDLSLICLTTASNILTHISTTYIPEGSCDKLKLSLVCSTHTTVECSGDSYNMLFERVHHVKEGFHFYCGEEPPMAEGDCRGSISQHDAWWMVHAAAYGQVFSQHTVCGLAQTKEWFGEDSETMIRDSPVLRDMCMETEEPPLCPCDLNEDLLLLIRNELTTVGYSPVCNVTAQDIHAFFDGIRGCANVFENDTVTSLKSMFMDSCSGYMLDEYHLVCRSSCTLPPPCDHLLCEEEDYNTCLTHHLAGCDFKDTLDAVIHAQVERDHNCADLDTEQSAVHLSHHPTINGLLMCLRPVVYDISREPLYPGEFCRAMTDLYDCLQHTGDYWVAHEHDMAAAAAQYSQSILRTMQQSSCHFLPETPCGEGTEADVVFVFDDSTIEACDHKDDLVALAKAFVQHVDTEHVHIGAARFCEQPVSEFHLDHSEDKDELMKALDDIYCNGDVDRRMHSVVDFLREDMFSEEHGNRRWAPDIAVFFINGMPSDINATLTAMTKAQDLGMEFIFVKIGDDFGSEQMLSDDELKRHVLRVANYSALPHAAHDFIELTCALISDYLLPFEPNGSTVCEALYNTFHLTQTTMLESVVFPFFSLDNQKDKCQMWEPWNDVPVGLAECGEGEQEYGERQVSIMTEVVGVLCHHVEPRKGCDLPAATRCLQKLVNSFILPAVSPCALYSNVEVCVKGATLACPEATAWPLTHGLDRWMEVAQSTCCPGTCDPAKAVMCFSDVQQMSRSPMPDWEGICASLEDSMSCAEYQVLGCERCQQDTVKAIGGKIIIPLAKICMDPPEFKCRAYAALECKKQFVEFASYWTGDMDEGYFCLKVFEARTCVHDLTVECDDLIQLSVRMSLEEEVIRFHGETCTPENILPVCYDTFVERLLAIFNFNPFNPDDPAYLYMDDVQYNATDYYVGMMQDDDEGDNEGDDEGDEGGQSENGYSSSSSTFSSITSMSYEDFMKVKFPKTYLGKQCRELMMAYLCVKESLETFPPHAWQGLWDIVQAFIQLAWMQCEDYLEPLYCHTCDHAATNVVCNANEMEMCDYEHRMCQTRVEYDAYLEIEHITKGCVTPYTCKFGCKDHTCTSCCLSSSCNQPLDGPYIGQCNLLEVSGCLVELSETFLKTDYIECSYVAQTTTCVDYVREECEVNGALEISETLSEFEKSHTVTECKVNATDSECGLYAVAALASLKASAIWTPAEDDLCTLLEEVHAQLLASQVNVNCGEKEITATQLSFNLLHSQLWFLDCGGAITPLPMCDPIAAVKYCMPENSSDCDLEDKAVCIYNYTEGCQQIQLVLFQHVLHIKSLLFCGEGYDEDLELPEDLSPLNQCLKTFRNTFDCSVLDPWDMHDPVDDLVVCLLNTWEVQFALSQSPCYKSYITEMFLFIYTVLIPGVAVKEDDVAVNETLVSSECRTSLNNAAPLFKVQVMLMMLRTFGCFSDNFCEMSGGIQSEIWTELSSCSLEDKKYQMRLFWELQAHHTALCPGSEPLPYCSVDMAHQCLHRFSAHMDIIVDDDDVDICIELTETWKCVENYVASCEDNDGEGVFQIKKDVYDTLSIYRSICPEEVSMVVCPEEQGGEGGEGEEGDGDEDFVDCMNSDVVSEALDACETGTMVDFTCRSIGEMIDCYKEATENCSDLFPYKQRFGQRYSLQELFALEFCSLDPVSWNLTADGCTPPPCDPTAGMMCLLLDDLNTNQSAHDNIESRIAEAVACLHHSLAGCDVTTQAHILHRTRAGLWLFMQLYPSLNGLGLWELFQVDFPGPFGTWGLALGMSSGYLDFAFFFPDWDLLPLCWWLHDTHQALLMNVAGSGFRKAMFKRGAFGMVESLHGVCNEIGTVGALLNLPPIEDEDSKCPWSDFMNDAARSVFEAALTPVIRRESRQHLCEILETVEDLDLSYCSKGRGLQMHVLLAFLRHVAGDVCRGTARYCSVQHVQQCATSVAATISGLGVTTSYDQVCSSIHMLDECVSRFSYRCDDDSVWQIHSSSRTIRSMAVTVCSGSQEPGNQQEPSCMEPDHDGCSLSKLVECSFTQVFDLLSPFGNQKTHCESLMHTHECYTKVNDSCTAEGNTDAALQLSYWLSWDELRALWDQWDCDAHKAAMIAAQSEEPPACSEHCHAHKAGQCVSHLETTLQFWDPLDGSVCHTVTETRECVMESVYDCRHEDQLYFMAKLTVVVETYQSLTALCTDVYSCLDSFMSLTGHILDMDDAPQPGDGGSMMTGVMNDTGDGEEGGGNSLPYLCHKARLSWNCVNSAFHLLSHNVRQSVRPVLESVWDVVEDRCENSVALECYTCTHVPYADVLNWDACQNETETCKFNEICFNRYTNKDNEVFVTRGCMRASHCRVKDPGDSHLQCCHDDHHCNAHTQDAGVSGEGVCYVEHSVQCAFDFVSSLITMGHVECASSLEKLECMWKSSEYCPEARSLYTGSQGVMLSLAQTRCVLDELSEQCSSIAVASVITILSNAYTSQFVCIGLNASEVSLQHQEDTGQCTALELVAMREALAYVSALAKEVCHPDTCITEVTEVTNAESTDSEKRPEDCDYFGTSLCARDVLSTLHEYEDANCSTLHKDAFCALTSLEGCGEELPICLGNLLDQVRQDVPEECQDFEEEEEAEDGEGSQGGETCQSAVFCDVTAALECTTTMDTSTNDTQRCMLLEQASECVSYNLKDCDSVVDTWTVMYTLRQTVKLCNQSMFDFLNDKEDVFQAAALCSLFYWDVNPLSSDEWSESLCEWAELYLFCLNQTDLPDLTEDYLFGDLTDFAQSVVFVCNASSSGGGEKRRKKRDADCDLEGKDVDFIVYSLVKFPLDDRLHNCKKLSDALNDIDDLLSADCVGGLSALMVDLLDLYYIVGLDQLQTYCPFLEYMQAGCERHFLADGIQHFVMLSSVANVEPPSLCRAAEDGLRYLHKFSTDCPEEDMLMVHAVQRQIMASVGDTCPELTLGLFCPDAYPEVSNPLPCDPARARACLPDDFNINNRVKDGYCSVLMDALTCARESVEGCLYEVIREVSAAVNGSDMQAEIAFCHNLGYEIGDNLTDYSSACAAWRPCSLKEAKECVFGDSVNASSCLELGAARHCMNEALASCPPGVEGVSLAHSFFFWEFGFSNDSCPSAFEDLTTDSAYGDSCQEDFLNDLTDALLEIRTQDSVCNVSGEYKNCLTKAASNDLLLASVLKPDYSFIDGMTNLYCGEDSDSVDASGVSESESCDTVAASHCLVQPLVWLFKRHLLPNADNQHACLKWHKQEILGCMEQATAECSKTTVQLFSRAVEMFNRLVLSSGVCDNLEVCYVKEAYYNINSYSVAIAKWTVDNDTQKLCLHQQDMEESVASFTANCLEVDKDMVMASKAATLALVQNVCDGVELPPPPICSQLPLDQRRCSIGAAFTCVVHFNMELLDLINQALFIQGKPIFEWYWHPWCTMLENTMHCAAYNTSSCDREDKDLDEVISALETLTQQAGNNCPWLSPDLCAPSPPCPAQEARCHLKLQEDLMENPLDDVCSVIHDAYDCVEWYTITCTPAQKEVAIKTIKVKLQQLSVPDLKCDGSEMAPCLLNAKEASWLALTNHSGACQAMGNATECLTIRMPDSPSAQQQTAWTMFLHLAEIVDGWCTTSSPDSCVTPFAQVLNTLYDFMISLTLKTFDTAEICSSRQALLADIKEVDQRGDCDISALNTTILDTGVFSQCRVEIQDDDCLAVNASANACFHDFNNTAEDDCWELDLLQLCLASALEVCYDSLDVYSRFDAFKTSVNKDCSQVLPIIILSTPVGQPLYLSERGGMAAITVYYMPRDAGYMVRVRAYVTNTDPPACFQEKSEEISQLSVIYSEETDNAGCGHELNTTGDEESEFSLRLVSTLDGRVDGLRKARVHVFADILQAGTEGTWIMRGQPVWLATYNVAIEDADVYAVCSVGGSYVETFDRTVYSNYYLVDDFILYRNTFIAAQVEVNYAHTVLSPTSICTTTVSTLSTSVTFDICHGKPLPSDYVAVTLEGEGDDLLVYRHQDLVTLYVVLPTGTVVTVKGTINRGLVVWIKASSLDFGKTEGLCGLYDHNGYNDLKLFSGSSYRIPEDEIHFGVLSPVGFIYDWRVDNAGNTPVGIAASESCGCMEYSYAGFDHCTALNRVTTCDLVQGEDITSRLIEAGALDGSRRKRRQAEDQGTGTTAINLRQNASWPTPNNWTADSAQAHCENLLDSKPALHYCAQAILMSNGTDPFDLIITSCVDNIRLTDSTANGDFSILQAMESCRSLFLHDTTYQQNDAVRQAVLNFFHHSCIDDCTGNGDCKMGVCECYPGFVGSNCSYQRTNLPSPVDTKVIRNGLCEEYDHSRCEDVFIMGQDFVESPYLSCHLQTVRMQSSGSLSPVSSPTKVSAILVTSTMIVCPVRRSDTAQQTIAIAISNDGFTPTSPMLYTAYDPRCYACDPFTHKCDSIVQDTDTCEIEGRCYMPEDEAKESSCLFCDPGLVSSKWSVRDLPECESFKDESSDEEEDEEEDDVEFSPLLIAVLVVGSILLVVVTIGVVLCIVKLRRGRQSRRDQEFGPMPHIPPPDYYNRGYMDPQQVFNQNPISKRMSSSQAPAYFASGVQPGSE